MQHITQQATSSSNNKRARQASKQQAVNKKKVYIAFASRNMKYINLTIFRRACWASGQLFSPDELCNFV